MVTLDLSNDVVNEETKVEYDKKGIPCISVSEVKNFMNKNKNEEITFNIATLGGDLGTGLIIHDLIKSHPKKTVGNIIGLTASAGTVIAEACDEVIQSSNALFLIHNGWKEVTGNVYDMQKAATDLMKTDAIMVKIYREKTGLPDEKIRAIMKESDWMSAEEALALGFVDSVYNSGMKIAASVSDAQRLKINNQLLITKLEQKMKNPFKKEAAVMNVLALKDGANYLINAEVPAAGVEVAPLGAASSLEDGEYPLQDGRTIVVVGGTITEVKEAPAPAADVVAEQQTAAIIAGVTKNVLAQLEPIQAQIDEIKKITSAHIPAKGKGPVAPVAAKAKDADVINRVDEIAKGIRDGIVNARQK
jgi:ATP-dependent protease ClpP protease subunit